MSSLREVTCQPACKKSRDGRQSFPALTRLNVAIDSASGLSHLVNATPRAFHRDIKCPNILLDKNGTAKMADFGLACVSQCTFHLPGNRAGTPGYTSPEYIQSGLVTESSEMYSFGMVMVEMLTGIPPAFIVPGKPKELDYIMSRLLDQAAQAPPKPEFFDSAAKASEFFQRLALKVDTTSSIPASLATAMGEVILRCTVHAPLERPRFAKVLEYLRDILRNPDEASQKLSDAREGKTNASAALPTPRIDDQAGPSPAVTQALPTGILSRHGPPSAHLKCVFAKGVDLDAITEDCRLFPLGELELMVGRGGSFVQAWETLVPETTYRNRISREHFKVIWRGSGEESEAGFILSCLSVNGLVFNDRFIRKDDECLLRNGDSISFEVIDDGSHAVRFLTFRYEDTASHVSGTAVVDVEIATGSLAAPPAEKAATAWLWCFTLGTYSNSTTLPLPSEDGEDVIVGRAGQYAGVWEHWLPEESSRAMVSREHFKIETRRLGNQLEFYLTCLSANGVALNGKYLQRGSMEAQLKPGDAITLLAVQDGVGVAANASAGRQTIVELRFERQDHGQTFMDESPSNRDVAALPQLPMREDTIDCDSPYMPGPLAVTESAAGRAAGVLRAPVSIDSVDS